jgi:thioredoxin-related protein
VGRVDLKRKEEDDHVTMKLSKVILFILLVTIGCTDKIDLTTLETDVDTKAIKFEYGRFSDALKESKESNKLIFAYVGSPYCKRCKQMERDVFPDTLVAKFLNENFICSKFYLKKTSASTKSNEYKQLNKSLLDFMDEYDCDISFPTFIILNSNGELIKKQTGFLNTQELIVFSQNTLSTDK